VSRPLGKTIKRSLIYYFVCTVLEIANTLPRRLALFAGEWLGLAAWWLLARDRHKIERHLTLVFGDELHEVEKRAVGRNFFVNSAKNIVDVARFRKHFQSEIKPLVEVEGLEYFDQAYRAGKGVLGITGHIGNFELLAAYIANLGYDIAVIGRELYDDRLNRLLVENRTALGLTNIATTDSPKKFLSWLHEGKAIGVLIDTDSIRVRSMFVPFFGRLSNTPVGQSILGVRAGAAFVPMVCVRTSHDRYRIIIRPAVSYGSLEDTDAAVYEVTLKCTQALEGIIRQYKDQWIWLHNPWHTRPEKVT
jgi:KDO2-lipid IV(A) lauroyltransferase